MSKLRLPIEGQEAGAADNIPEQRLTSDVASYITDAIIPVEDGYTLTKSGALAFPMLGN